MSALVAYVRKESGAPFGVVVATAKNEIGWSRCHTTYDCFNKEDGKLIAMARASHPRWKKKLEKVFSSDVDQSKWMPFLPKLPAEFDNNDVFAAAIAKMEDRARRYFKDKV